MSATSARVHIVTQMTPAKRRATALSWHVRSNDKARRLAALLRRTGTPYGERPQEFTAADWRNVSERAVDLASRYYEIARFADACADLVEEGAA